MGQMGFYFDADNCIGCHTCQVACKDVNRLEVGVDFRHVTSWCTGSGCDVHMYHVSMGCNHCFSPACFAECATGAISKQDDGTVVIDEELCIGCGTCVVACPYGAPVLIEEKGIAMKCDGCASLRAQGELPACVSSCPQRALEFGDIDELKAAHAKEDLVADCVVLPDSSKTSPSLAMRIKECMLDEDVDQLIL